MQKRITRLIITGILLLIGYFFASRHIIINAGDFRTLKKSYLTFEYTFYNVTDRDAEDILRIDMLREAGIGDLLVDMGLLGEMRKENLELRFESQKE